MQKFQDTENI